MLIIIKALKILYYRQVAGKMVYKKCRYLVVNGIFKNSQHNQQIITILHELPFTTVMVILPQMKPFLPFFQAG